MSNFLTNIHINKIFHLENIDIPIDEKEKKHLIITGKNGSGKTSLLNALLAQLQLIKDNKIEKFITIDSEELQYNQENDKYGWKIELEYTDKESIIKKVKRNKYTLAFYSATRTLKKIIIPQSPEKPNLELSKTISDSKSKDFLKFLVDLKSQEAFASKVDEHIESEKINEWFSNFENLLKRIFDCKNLKLEFNYKDYSFTINQDDHRFGFDQLADGYSAIIDIVSDLILKMQDSNSLIRAYEKEGIVLIDEIETHLHLELQRLILPMLTQVFPNIQFIVTTHSPFVLNSIDNAVVFDLERNLRLENLTKYSYEALAEGFFKVDTDSAFLQSKLNRFKELAHKTNRDNAETYEYQKLDKEFSSLNDALTPQYIKGEYLKTKLKAKP